MEKGSFGSKLFFSVFDKLILAVLAAGIVFLFQQNMQRSQKLKDQVMAVSKVKSDILISQRNKMIDTMDNYFLLIEEIKPLGQSESKQTRSLRQLRLKIELIKFNSDAISSKLGEDLELFHSAVNEINHFLIEKKSSKEEIEAEANKVRDNYSTALRSFQGIIVETIKSEYGESS